MNKAIVILALVTVIIVSIASIVIFKRPAPTVFVSVDEIKKVAQLATMVYVVSAYHLETVKRAKISLACDEVWLFTVKATVKGLIDLNHKEVKIRKSAGDAKVWEISLPDSAVIIEVSSPEEEEKNLAEAKFWSEVTSERKTEIRKNLLNKLKETAEKDGIRKKTLAHARTILTALLTTSYGPNAVKFVDTAL